MGVMKEGLRWGGGGRLGLCLDISRVGEKGRGYRYVTICLRRVQVALYIFGGNIFPVWSVSDCGLDKA